MLVCSFRSSARLAQVCVNMIWVILHMTFCASFWIQVCARMRERMCLLLSPHLTFCVCSRAGGPLQLQRQRSFKGQGIQGSPIQGVGMPMGGMQPLNMDATSGQAPNGRRHILSIQHSLSLFVFSQT